MILIGQYDSPFVRRVAVTLHVYAVAFSRSPLSVFSNFDALKNINPLRRVPALVLDDGETLVDSHAIVDYLDEQADADHALMPERGVLRRQMLRVIAVASGISDKTVQLSMEQMFHAPVQRSATLLARCAEQITSSLQQLEDAAGPSWLCGEHFSHADIMTGCTLGHLHLRQPQLFTAADYPKLHAFKSRCEATPAFQSAQIGAQETVPSQL